MLRTVAVRWQLYEISSESLSSSSSPIGSLIIQQKTQENSVETTVFWGRKKQNVLSTLEEGKKRQKLCADEEPKSHSASLLKTCGPQQLSAHYPLSRMFFSFYGEKKTMSGGEYNSNNKRRNLPNRQRTQLRNRDSVYLEN